MEENFILLKLSHYNYNFNYQYHSIVNKAYSHHYANLLQYFILPSIKIRIFYIIY